MKFGDVIRFTAIGVAMCIAAIVPALTMGGGAVADPLRVGDRAPALTVSQWVRGAPVTLGASGESIVVVAFWATYCPPCRDALPLLSDLQDRYADDGVRVVCIGNETPERTTAYLDTFTPPLRISFAIDDRWNTSKQYLDGLDATGIPYAVLVGGDGRIVWHGNPLTGGADAALRGVLDIAE